MIPALLLWTCREGEGWVLCREGHKQNLWRPPLFPILLARNTNNLLDLQEGDKQKALVNVLEVSPR